MSAHPSFTLSLNNLVTEIFVLLSWALINHTSSQCEGDPVIKEMILQPGRPGSGPSDRNLQKSPCANSVRCWHYSLTPKWEDCFEAKYSKTKNKTKKHCCISQVQDLFMRGMKCLFNGPFSKACIITLTTILANQLTIYLMYQAKISIIILFQLLKCE